MGDKDGSATQKFASRLKQEREQRAWTQKEVAKRIGSTRPNISRWENGITIPSLYYRQKLGELFAKSPQELGFISEDSKEDAVVVATPSDSHIPSPALPIWNMPYRHNPFFTGREAILSYLYNVLRGRKVVVLTQPLAINGLGGIGKTEIAVEYVYRYHKDYKAIFWINASSRELCNADFVSLAALLNLPEQHEQDEGIVVRAVKRWMSVQPNWLLILDNVDKLEIINDYLPLYSMGDILITTRLQALGTIAQSIEVEKMGLDESVRFLLYRTKFLDPGAPLRQATEESRAQAVEIVTALDGLPLALDQAGAYIEETHCGLSQFTNLFVSRRKELLVRRGGSLGNHPDSVVATWSLSFQQVEHESQAAADLLHLLAFLNPEAIPEEIITRGATGLGLTLDSAVRDPLMFDATIELLLRYSLIRRNSEAKCLSIHRLVQAVLKDTMDKDTQPSWAERTIRVMHKAFPPTELNTWEGCQRYLPHVIVCAMYLDEYQLVIAEGAQLLNDTAEYLIVHGQYKQAEWLLQKALAIRQKVLEAHQPEIARTLNNLGVCYRKLGEYALAEEFHRKALRMQESIFGRDHPDIAESEYNLARLYRAQGLYLKAEPFYWQALHIRKTTLGMGHPLVAQSYYGLGKLYHSLEKYEQAEELCRQALYLLENSVKKNEHMITATLFILAKIYREQNKLDEAEEMNSRALRIREDISGADHPQVASIINNQIEVYLARGRYVEAESLIARSLRLHEQSLGAGHPYMAYGFSNLGESFFLQEDYVQAETYYKKALALREQTLGADHPHTASSYSQLARLYSVIGRYEEADRFCLNALSVRERAFGLDHPSVARTLEQYATLLRKQRREIEAREIEARINVIRTG